MGAEAGQPPGRRLADAARRARHDRDGTLQFDPRGRHGRRTYCLPDEFGSPVASVLLCGSSTGCSVNTLVSGVTSSFLWFALTFWVYLETRSVVATGVIGGAFSISSAVLGPFFGTFVDRHRKHTAMVLTTAVSAACFAVATVVFVTVDTDDLLRLRSPWFWVLVGSRCSARWPARCASIALSTCVTLLVPEDRRDRANGMVGTVTGLSFAITSVFSGLVIGQLGMGWAYYGSLALTIGALVHLRTIHIDEPEPEPAPEGEVRRATSTSAARSTPSTPCPG